MCALSGFYFSWAVYQVGLHTYMPEFLIVLAKEKSHLVRMSLIRMTGEKSSGGHINVFCILYIQYIFKQNELWDFQKLKIAGWEKFQC